MSGLYVLLEGSVGAGKSLLGRSLQEALQDTHPTQKVVLTREPGGDLAADEIRRVVQGSDYSGSLTPEASMALYTASRAQTLCTVVEPWLELGAVVISDRGFPSSVAYQGYAQGLGLDFVFDFNWPIVKKRLPDLIIYLNVPPVIGLQRTKHGGVARLQDDVWEHQQTEFFERVCEGYTLLSRHPVLSRRWFNIDATLPPQIVLSKAFSQIALHLHKISNSR